MVLRSWRGAVRPEDAPRYLEHQAGTGVAEYRATPGNLAAHMLTRDLDDGRTEVVTLSLWESLEAVHGFAGDDVSAAVFYPEDDRYLVDREVTVSHFQVHDGA